MVGIIGSVRRTALACVAALVLAAAADAAAPIEAKAAPAQGAKQALTDAQIKKLLIEESIAAYSGSCPCPYSTARNGSRCGKRSAWSRAGGQEPLCYPDDVSAEMVREYRAAHPDD